MNLAEEIPTLGEHGHDQHGPWTQFWAEAGRPVYNHKERMAIMTAQGFQADDFHLEDVHVVNKLGNNRYRTWWYARPMEPGMPWRA